MKKTNLITLIESDIANAASIQLMSELSDVLKGITGSSAEPHLKLMSLKIAKIYLY